MTVIASKCAGCGEWHETLGHVLWGDGTAWLCGRCMTWYRQLRTRPETLYLHWPPPKDGR